MDLSRSILKNFAKITNDRSTKSTTTYLCGEAVIGEDGKKYVKIDGSEQITPVSAVTDIQNGDRVMVSIENHTATVIGNYSYPPSLRTANNALEVANQSVASYERLNAIAITTENLTANVAQLGYLTADEASIAYAKITELDALKADIDDIEAKSITTETLTAEVAKLGYVTADQVEADYAKITDLDATKASVEDLESKSITTETLTVEVAKLGYAKVTELEVVEGKIDTLTSKSITTDNLSAKVAELGYATVTQLEAEVADINDLFADYATINQLNTLEANINEASIGYAKIVDLDAAKADIDVLESDVADIQTLVNGNLTSDNIQSLTLNSSNVTIANGTIKSAMIESLAFGKITGLNINTTNLTIHSEDGKSTWSDNTIQISDANRVRVQIGKDASDDYTLAVWDAAGNLIWDALGATENTIQRKIIRDAVVADDAAIAGSKLYIPSVVEEINGATTKLKSTTILVDKENQTLDVYLNTLETTVGDNLDAAKLYADGQLSTAQAYALTQANNALASANSYTDDEIDGIEIGGRNLVIGSSNASNLSTWKINGWNPTIKTYSADERIYECNTHKGWSAYGYPVSEYAGETLTVSGWFKLDGDRSTNTEDIYIVFDTTDTVGLVSWNTNNVLSTDEWTYLTATFASALNYIQFMYRGAASDVGTGNAYVLVKDFKIEKGNIATDWTAAPEDTETEIQNLTEITTTHTTDISVMQGQITTLIAEDTTIKGDYDALVSRYNSTVTDVDSIKTTIGEHTTLLDTQSGEILAVTTKANTIESDLESTKQTVSSVQSDLTSTQSRVTEVETSLDGFSVSLSETNQTVSDNYTALQEYADSAVAGIQIGGRNWISNSAFLNGFYGWRYNATYVSLDNERTRNDHPSAKIEVAGETSNRWFGVTKRYIPDGNPLSINSGEIWTVSCWYYIEDTSTLDAAIGIDLKGISSSDGLEHVAGGVSVNANTATIGKWTKLEKTFTLKYTYTDCYVYAFVARNGTVWFTDFKLEKGTKATDWTPAPEDVDEKFTNYSTTTQMESAIELSKTSILSTVSENYTTNTEYSTLSGKVETIETWKTEASQKITKDGIIGTVGKYYAYQTDLEIEIERITVAESKITQNADNIELRVEKSGVISAINQSAESITIDATKVNLSGYVTITNLATAGATTIDGANITTGKISADRIDVDGLFAKDITAEGSITGLILISEVNVEGGSYRAVVNGGTVTASYVANDYSTIGLFSGEGLSFSTDGDSTKYSSLSSSLLKVPEARVSGTIYEGGTALSSKYLAKTGGTLSGNLTISISGASESQINVSNGGHSGRLVSSASYNFGLYDATYSKWLVKSDTSGNVSYASGTFTGDIGVNHSDTTNSAVVVRNSLKKGALVVSAAGQFGLYDQNKGKWLLYSDTSGNVTLNGNANTATTAKQVSTTIGDGTTAAVLRQSGVSDVMGLSIVTTNSAGTSVFHALLSTASDGTVTRQWVYPSEVVKITGGTFTGTVAAPTLQCNVLKSKSGTVNITMSDAAFKPTTSNAYSLGSAKRLWSTVYAKTSEINTSDEMEKDILPRGITEAHEKWFMDLEPILYRWKQFDWEGHVPDRIHCGLGARRSVELAAKHGLSMNDISALCYDVFDEPLPDGRTDRYGIRYGELHGYEIHMIQKNARNIVDAQTKISEIVQRQLTQEDRLNFVTQQLHEALCEINTLKEQLKAQT